MVIYVLHNLPDFASWSEKFKIFIVCSSKKFSGLWPKDKIAGSIIFCNGCGYWCHKLLSLET